MSRRLGFAVSLSTVSVVLGLAGCVEQNWLVPQTPAAPAPFAKSSVPTQSNGIQPVSGRFKSTQQARVDEVGRKLLDANKALALKPTLEVQSGASLEISHQGDHRIVISEGLVNACEGDGQLAAVLAVEMGRMVAERQTRQNGAVAEEDRLPPVDVPLGPDGGGYGTQARQAELAKLGFGRNKSSDPVPAADPNLLGQQILTRAGFRSSDLAAAAGLLKSAAPVQR